MNQLTSQLAEFKKSERETVTTRIHPQVKLAAVIRAAQEGKGRSMADVIEDALIAHLCLSSPETKAS